MVGGLSRTSVFEGNRFDVGPHRFFTKNQEVHRLFVETVAADLLNVPRLTRIFYNNKYFNYPLTPLNALFGVGFLSSLSILSSYTMTRVGRALGDPPIQNFEDWVVDRFGRRLFETFFKTYTEKVWAFRALRSARTGPSNVSRGLVSRPLSSTRCSSRRRRRSSRR